MKKQHEEVEKICAYCESATVIREADLCICKEYGAVKANSGCKRFSLDLLKLAPTPRILPNDETVFFDI